VLNQPIVIGDATIAPGDLIVGDRDGVIVVPGGIADEAVVEATAVIRTESAMRKDILNGMDPKAAYLKHRKF
jgi:regulator of RNase E activity RraA